MDTSPRIKTTTVGSYPVPAWLGNAPSEQDIVDATRVILHTKPQGWTSCATARCIVTISVTRKPTA